MSSRHPLTLIEIMRIREGRRDQAALLEDRPLIISGASQSESTQTDAGGPRTETGDALVAGTGSTFPPTWTPQYAEVEIVLNAGGAVLQPGPYMDVVIPFACVIVEWAMYADQVTTTRIDLWSDTDANFPPTIADTMPGTDPRKPQLTAAARAKGPPTSWTKTAFAAGDVLRVNLDTNSAATRLSLGLKVRKT